MCECIWFIGGIVLTPVLVIYLVTDGSENWKLTKGIIKKFKKETNKERYDDLIIKKKLQAVKLGKYKLKYEDDYWFYIYIDGIKEYELSYMTFYKGNNNDNRYQNIVINGKEYHYFKSDLKKKDKYLQIIFKQILKQNKIKDKQEKKEAFIQEEIEYAQKIKDLMGIEIKTSKKVQEEFSEVFEKAERLNKITNKAIRLMKEAKKIRKEF